MTMPHYTIVRFVLAAALFTQTGLALAMGSLDAEARFLEARDAFRAGERARLARLEDALHDTDFAPWVEQWRLRLRLEDGNSDGVREYLQRERGSYLAEKLRSEWLKRIAKNQDWELFQREYAELAQPDQELACAAWQARLARQKDVTALEEARPLWFSATELPETCQPVMERLLAEGALTPDDVWMRMRRLVESRRLSAAKALGAQLPRPHAFDARAFEAMADNPARYLTRLPGGFAATRGGRETAIFAAVRLARADSAAAAQRWHDIEARFGEADRAYVWGQIAWQAALNHKPEAVGWYEHAGAARLTDEQVAWQARAALRVGDWAALAKAIADMPQRLADQPEWIYWLGRAHATQGKREEAMVLFQKIAGRPTFYGNLADEELGRPLVFPPRPAAPTAEELSEIENNRGLRRAMAVLRVDSGSETRIEAVREWAWYLRGMSDRQLLAVAEVSRRQGVIDRSISAAERTALLTDFTLRYPAPFHDRVTAKVRENALEDAWVYGLMRQESRFVTDARSSAGARGLMQLMPSTARWVARKIGLSDYQPSRVAELETNVTLGTGYLKMVYESLDNQPVLASAAYNAGPNRARKWQADRPLEGAIYAETIPFNETRDYVKKVMSNTAYYAARFENRPQSLKARLGVVRSRIPGDDVPVELP